MANSIDLVLDQCLADLLSGRASVESCLTRYPAQAAQLEPVLRAAMQLQRVPPVPGLSPARRQALENRVMARVQARLPRNSYQARPAQSGRTTRLSFWQRRLTWAAAGVMSLLVLTATTVGASAASLPGDFLYPVKQLTEQATLALTPPEALPAVHAELAQRRLGEFAALMNRGEVMPTLLDDASSELNLALDDSRTLPSDQQETLLKAVEQLNTRQIEAVNAALEKAPDAAKPGLENALDRIKAAQMRQQLKQEQVAPPMGNGSDGKPAEPPGAGKGQPPSAPPGQANPPGHDNNSPSDNAPGQQGQGQQGQGQQGQGQQNGNGKGNK